MSVYLSDTLAGTCGLATDAHVQYVRDRIQGHPYAGTQCKQASLQKLDAMCLAGMLTDDIAEAILQEFESNYGAGKCNTTTGGGTRPGPQCPDGYEYDTARSVCVETHTTTTTAQHSDWLSDNWPWLVAGGVLLLFFITRR